MYDSLNNNDNLQHFNAYISKNNRSINNQVNIQEIFCQTVKLIHQQLWPIRFGVQLVHLQLPKLKIKQI